MALHSADRDEEPVGDLPVGEAVAQEGEDLLLARREVGDASVGLGTEIRGFHG